MKRLLPCPLLLCAMITTAQWTETELSLADYKLPDVRYAGLELSGTLFGSINQRTIAFDPVLPLQRQRGFNWLFDLSYFTFANDVHKQNSSFLHGAINAGWGSFEANAIQRTFSLRPSLLGSHQFRKYTARRFREIAFRHSMHIFPRVTKQSSPIPGLPLTRISENSVQLAVNPYLLFGVGRIEPLEDAAIAYFLLEDLYQNGLLATAITQHDLVILADRMATARLTRVFDFREKFKYELSRIDDAVRAMGWIDEVSIEYFTILADNWRSAIRPVRGQGRRTSVGIAPGLLLQSYNQKIRQDGQMIGEDDSSHLQTMYLYGILQHRNERPLSIRWQRSAGSEIAFGYELNNHESDVSKIERQAGHLVGFYGYGYYPNSRTRWTNTLEGSLHLQRMHKTTGNAARVHFNSSISYFLSPRTFLSGSVRIQWNTMHRFKPLATPFSSFTDLTEAPLYLNPFKVFFSSEKRVVTTFNIRLRHSIF